MRYIRLFHLFSPRNRLASCISLGMMVTRFAWIAQRFVSSKNPTMYASTASCNALTAPFCILKLSPNISFITWRKRRRNGPFLIKSSVDFWYLRISLSAASPGRSLCKQNHRLEAKYFCAVLKSCVLLSFFSEGIFFWPFWFRWNWTDYEFLMLWTLF